MVIIYIFDSLILFLPFFFICRSEVVPTADNPQFEQYVVGLVNALINEIESKAAAVTDAEYFLIKLKLAEAAKMFRHRYK